MFHLLIKNKLDRHARVRTKALEIHIKYMCGPNWEIDLLISGARLKNIPV